MKKLCKSAVFSDIHFGRKSNSPQHNQDCINYIKWFCEQVTSDPLIDHILFLGDWHEHRSSLSIDTLHYSYIGAELLNSLGLPIYFCVGNHDLHHRHTREIHSVVHFTEFSNFIIINEPQVIKTIADGAMLSPYLFDHEYTDTAKMLTVPFWAGHFEFKDFIITGHSIKMQSGPNPADFKGPSHILSGHFHKRQTMDNITYVGNTFPMDFSDVHDSNRGMAIMDHITGKLSFINWGDCPMYIKASLSDILEGVDIPTNARVKCIVDIPITFEESTIIKDTYTSKHDLREFFLEEVSDAETLSDTETSIDLSDANSIDEMIVKMLLDIKNEHIDANKLVSIYQGLSN